MNKFLSSKNQEARKENQPQALEKAKQSCLVLSVFVLKNDDLPEKHIFAFISISNCLGDKHMCMPPSLLGQINLT